MATYSDIAHMWANKNFGKNGYLQSGNVSCDEINFRSYNTVIGQWLDKDKNVVVIIDENLSPSTAKHISALVDAVPKDVTVFRIHRSSWRMYDDVYFIDSCTPFNKEIRMQMVEIYIDNIYRQYSEFKNSSSLKTKDIDYYSWGAINELNSLYNNDASLKKWLRKKINPLDSPNKRKELTVKRKMVRAMLEGLSDKRIVDAVCGKGSYDAWYKRTEPLRKASRTRELGAKIAKYLRMPGGFSSYSWKDLSTISPARRTQIKFANIENTCAKQREQQNKKDKSFKNALKYIGITLKASYSSDVAEVVDNASGKKIYFMERYPWEYDYSENIKVTFGPKEYREFKDAPDKKHWVKRFHDLCAIKRNRIIAKNLWYDIRNGKRAIEDFSPTELAFYDAYMYRLEKYERDRELREAREAEERRLREAELEAKRRAEREEKLQKLNEYKAEGIEGLRKIWRNHVGPIPEECRYDKEYFYGGNVLLRFENNELIGTSKSIKIPVSLCKSVFKKIQKWHENPSQFEPINIKTSCGNFRISSYKNDILTAGCHDIAYVEMERMYNEIINNAL